MRNHTARVFCLSPNLKGLSGGINRIQPGMGIACLAAVLRQQGHEVSVRDTALEGYDNQRLLPDGKTVLIGETDNQISQHIRSLQPDIVGISVVFSNLADSARNIARIVKSVTPATHTVIGGNHVTNAYKDFFYAKSANQCTSSLAQVFLRDMNEESIDYAMVGEADFEFSELVHCLANNMPINAIKNLVYRDDANEIRTVSEPLTRTVARPDIAALPHPAWDLFNMPRYFEIGAFQSPRTNAEKILPLMVSRGCPEVCTFCTTPDTWGMRVRLEGREQHSKRDSDRDCPVRRP